MAGTVEQQLGDIKVIHSESGIQINDKEGNEVCSFDKSESKNLLAFIKQKTREGDAQENRELTFGEKAVGLTFNHGEGEIFEKINDTKIAFAELIDMITPNGEVDNGTYMMNALHAMAISACIAAQMAVVKFITWKD